MEFCKLCRFWMTSQICRRNPVHVGHGPDDWCGEYRAPEASQAQEKAPVDVYKLPQRGKR
jgi:hypothetical protein